MKKKTLVILLVGVLILSNFFSFNLGKANSGSEAPVFGIGGSLEDEQEKRLVFLENYIQENYFRDVTREELYTGQLEGMVDALNDPYSEYLTKEEYEELMEDTSGKFFGIGVYINNADRMVTVVSPIRNTPAEDAGLLPGDKIVKVNGEEVTGDDISKASKMIRGEKGSEVTLTIIRVEDNGPRTFDVDVMRDEITVVTVESEMLEDDILYVSISQFNENTYKEFVEAVNNSDKNTKGMILDLRSNPGGLLSVCEQVADYLLPEGLIYYTEDKEGEIMAKGYSDEEMLDLPIVTLINGGTASASEIVSGALRDYDRTTLVGEKTFGKGVVQSINRFSTEDGIKLTISEYFTPKGITIHELGIKPDVEVKLDDPTIKIGPENLEKDNQLQRGIEILKENM